MLQGLLSFLFFLSSVFLILLILVQKGKSSIGMGSLGGGSQMLFGSSGGQDLFQKITWVLGTILLAGSLFLGIMKVRNYNKYRRQIQVAQTQAAAQRQTPQPALDSEESEE